MIPESGKQRQENLEKLAGWLKSTRNRETTPEVNDGVIEVRLARTCDNGSYPTGNSRTYPLVFLDGPNGVYKDHSGDCQVIAYSLLEDCNVPEDTKVLAWRQNNEWWFLPALCGTGDKIDHILVCKPDAAITDCCLYDARMIEHRKGPEGFCNEVSTVTPVWARCANGFKDSLPDGYCVLGKLLDEKAVCTLEDIPEERDVYLIDCGNCPNCGCPDPCDTLTARIQILPDICGFGESSVSLKCVDGNPLQVDDGEDNIWWYGEFEVPGQEQRMLWGAGGRVHRETSPGVFTWVDESFWLELSCNSNPGTILGVYYQNDPPGSDPVTEDYELQTGIEGCCPFLDSDGNPQFIERTYHYALTIACDTVLQSLDSLRIWWIKDGFGRETGDMITQTTACDDACPNPRPTLTNVPGPTGWWAAQSFASVGECCANSKRFKTELLIDECNQNFATSPEIRISGIPDIVPGTGTPGTENENICPGCVMGGSHIFGGCDCGELACDGGDVLPKICDFTPGNCLTSFIVVDISWPLSWGA
jgi:hypothetical protein